MAVTMAALKREGILAIMNAPCLQGPGMRASPGANVGIGEVRRCGSAKIRRKMPRPISAARSGQRGRDRLQPDWLDQCSAGRDFFAAELLERFQAVPCARRPLRGIEGEAAIQEAHEALLFLIGASLGLA